MRRFLGASALAAASAAFAFSCAASDARAAEVQVATGPGAYASSWRGDGAFGEALKVGFRFGDLVAVDATGRLGYGTVDQRVLTYLSLGATIYGRIKILRPYARLAVVHQHEESASAVEDDPFGAVFGVGNGIRHRGGAGSSLGLEIPVYHQKTAEFVVGLDASGAWFPDDRGPTFYFGGALWAGLNYGL